MNQEKSKTGSQYSDYANIEDMISKTATVTRMEMLSKPILKGGEEVPPMKGTLNEHPLFGWWASLALWLSPELNTAEGKPYSTIEAAIRHGLTKYQLPYVAGLIYEIPNPADRAYVAAGSYRLSVYNVDHTNQVVNTALDEAYRNRKSTVSLTLALREKCGCGTPGCWIHPKGAGAWKTGAGASGSRQIGSGVRSGNCAGFPTGEYELTGDVATDYQNKPTAGLRKKFKVPVFGMVGYGVNRRPAVVDFRTFTKRGGNGKNPTTKVAYRYPTSCGVCGKKACWTGCIEDSHGHFTIAETDAGRTLGVLDPRRDDFAETWGAMESQISGSLVVKPEPFNSGLEEVA